MQSLLFVSVEDDTHFNTSYCIEEADCDYCLEIAKKDFVSFSIDTVDDNKTKTIRANRQQNLEWCYEYERGEYGVKGNVTWFWAYAEQGIPDAQYNVGKCYEEGEGVEKNVDEATKWYLMAAEKGNTDAQFRLGIIYSNRGFFTHDEKEYLLGH